MKDIIFHYGGYQFEIIGCELLTCEGVTVSNELTPNTTVYELQNLANRYIDYLRGCV